MRRTEALASVKFYQILWIFIFFIRLIILEDFIRLISYNGPCVRLGCSFFLATALLRQFLSKAGLNLVDMKWAFAFCKINLILGKKSVTALCTWDKASHGNMCIYIYIYLADFLKTNLAKFAVIWVKKGSKGTFLKPKKFQNHSNEAKGKEEKEERGEGKEEKKKKQWLHS